MIWEKIVYVELIFIWKVIVLLLKKNMTVRAKNLGTHELSRRVHRTVLKPRTNQNFPRQWFFSDVSQHLRTLNHKTDCHPQKPFNGCVTKIREKENHSMGRQPSSAFLPQKLELFSPCSLVLTYEADKRPDIIIKLF